MWAGDGRSLFFVSDRSGAENIWQIRDRAPAGAAPGDAASPTAACCGRRSPARGDAIVFERNFGIWKLDTASGKAARGADHADGRARRARRSSTCG